MRAWLSAQSIMFYILAVITAAGMIIQAVTNHVYKRLIKEADHVEQADNRLIKYIKLKYSSFYKIGISPNDGQAMVRKYFEKYKLGPLTLSGWSRCDILFIGLILICSFVNILYEMYKGRALTDSIQTLMMAAIAICILLMQKRWYAFGEKKTSFVVSMDDYIQNYLKNKMEYGKVLDAKISDEQTQTAATSMERRRTNTHRVMSEKNSGRRLHTEDDLDASVVEDILKEFLN